MTLLICAPAAAADRPYDGAQQLLYDEASEALAAGNYVRAEQLFWRLTEILPDDARALREAGRAAFALGDLEYAERTLAHVETLQAGAPDPEIRYLRAQALIALGRDGEGAAEMAEAERQLSPTPPDRQSTLWLARIYALRGEVSRSTELYRTQLPADHGSAEYAEVMLYIVEAHILGKDWVGAERILRAFNSEQPGNTRGRVLLAWVLEGRGKIDEELSLRSALALGWRDHPAHVVGYARALDRAHEDAAALKAYREARELGAEDLDSSIRRVALRRAPELAAGMTFGSDLSGSMLGWVAGATLPISSRIRVAVNGSGTTAASTLPLMTERATSSSVGAMAFYARRGTVIAAGPTLRLPGVTEGVGLGGSAALRTPPGRRFELHLAVAAGQPWRESTSTIREGGIVDSASVEAFTTLFSGRVIAGVTAQGRRLGLAPEYGMDAPHALQLFGAAAVDVVLWSSPTRVARGQVLDENMMWDASFSSSLIVAFRHYELFSDDPFGPRLVLVDRSRVEELSATFRHVLDSAGAVGFELHGGIGPDTARELLTSRAGGALLVSATATSRLSAGYDFASQIGTGPSGLRHTGWVTLHVDL